MTMTLRRLACHAVLLGLITASVFVIKLPWGKWAMPSPAVAAAVETPAPTPNSISIERSRNAHAAHITDPLAMPSADIIRLAEPHTEKPNTARPFVITYTIAAGDTPFSIATRFGLKPETILWGNPLLTENAEALTIGTVINILPVDGVLHYAAEGDTVERIQLLYGAPIDDFVSYPGNSFLDEPPYTLSPGQKVVVPGGRKPIVWQEPGPPVVKGRGRKSPGYYGGPLVKVGTGYFMWPVPPDVITQYYWAGHPGLDLDTYLGQPIVAADTGTVIFSGWDDTGFGYLVIVDHGNDFWTYYGHNSQNLVNASQGVEKGETIALSGSTGNSTGEHIDFRIRYQAAAFLDPLLFLP